MKNYIRKNKQYISSGDFVYSKCVDKYGFVCFIGGNYYFINKDDFENWSDQYNKLSELVHKLNLELIAKNKDLKISLKDEDKNI